MAGLAEKQAWIIKFPSLEMSAVNPDLSGAHMNVATMICAQSQHGDMTHPVNAVSSYIYCNPCEPMHTQ
jgi:hypothetical protein